MNDIDITRLPSLLNSAIRIDRGDIQKLLLGGKFGGGSVTALGEGIGLRFSRYP